MRTRSAIKPPAFGRSIQAHAGGPIIYRRPGKATINAWQTSDPRGAAVFQGAHGGRVVYCHLILPIPPSSPSRGRRGLGGRERAGARGVMRAGARRKGRRRRETSALQHRALARPAPGQTRVPPRPGLFRGRPPRTPCRLHLPCGAQNADSLSQCLKAMMGQVVGKGKSRGTAGAVGRRRAGRYSGGDFRSCRHALQRSAEIATASPKQFAIVHPSAGRLGPLAARRAIRISWRPERPGPVVCHAGPRQ